MKSVYDDATFSNCDTGAINLPPCTTFHRDDYCCNKQAIFSLLTPHSLDPFHLLPVTTPALRLRHPHPLLLSSPRAISSSMPNLGTRMKKILRRSNRNRTPINLNHEADDFPPPPPASIAVPWRPLPLPLPLPLFPPLPLPDDERVDLPPAPAPAAPPIPPPTPRLLTPPPEPSAVETGDIPPPPPPPQLMAVELDASGTADGADVRRHVPLLPELQLLSQGEQQREGLVLPERGRRFRPRSLSDGDVRPGPSDGPNVGCVGEVWEVDGEGGTEFLNRGGKTPRKE